MKEFRGRTAFVTGGASGIGLGMARAFGRAGMNVVLADIDDAVQRHSCCFRQIGAQRGAAAGEELGLDSSQQHARQLVLRPKNDAQAFFYQCIAPRR